MQAFHWPVRVYYEDTDSGGVVYHANYLRFMERARTEWLRALGIEQDWLLSEHECLFAVHSMTLNFRQPARFNDLLKIESNLLEINGASLYFAQKIYRDDELLCEATVRVASLDAKRFRPRPMPRFLLTEMQREC